MKKLMYDPLNIVICGIGGQGNVLAAELVARSNGSFSSHGNVSTSRSWPAAGPIRSCSRPAPG